MAYLSAIYIPAFEFHFNLVVYPLPAEERNVSNLKKLHSIFKEYCLRVRVTSVCWRTMLSSLLQQEGRTGWSSCQTISTASCHPLTSTRVKLRFMTTFQSGLQSLSTAWKFSRLTNILLFCCFYILISRFPLLWFL